MLQVLWPLLLVTGLALLLRAGLSLAGRGRGRERLMRVVESCALGGRQRLHVVEVDGERLLIGATESSVRLLRRLGPGALLAPATSPIVSRADGGGRGSPFRRLLGALRAAALLAPLGMLLAGAAARAEPSLDADLVSGLAGALGSAGEPERVSSTLQIVALLTLVSVAPSILLLGTCFTRILIVLALLRQAIGIQQLPPSQVLSGLALFVTFFVMAPVGERIHSEALEPYVAREIGEGEAAARALLPIREYLAEFTREEDLALFTSLSERPAPASLDEVPLSTLLPAFVLSELRTAFEIGFTIYLPFLVVDLVISSLLISMGMIVLPPIVISLPFKLMLFVLLDGWNLVIGSLVAGLR